MTAPAELLQTPHPRILKRRQRDCPPPQPVDWGLDVFRANPAESALQVTEADAQTRYIDETDPASMQRFADGIQQGRPVHGRIAVVDYCAGEGSVRDSADWAWDAFSEHFLEPMQQRHPMGFYMKAMLWMSCGEHCYAAHNDLADGFLMHMAGRKRVRVWPLPESCRAPILFQHGNFDERMSSEPEDFDLEPGQILFIPSGAMHEVVARGEEPARRSACTWLTGGAADSLRPVEQTGGGRRRYHPAPRHDRSGQVHPLLFRADPLSQRRPASRINMPEPLVQALLPVLESARIDAALMRELLTLWWRIALTQPIYLGPYPPTA